MTPATLGAPEEVDPGLGPPPPPSLGIWELALPSMATFALEALVGLVDFLIVGSLGGEAIAGVGLATQVLFGIFAVLAAVTTGTVALVARAKGAGDLREADRVLRLSVLLGAGLGLLLMLAMPFTAPLVSLFGVEPGVVAIGGSYLWIVLAFNVPLAVEVVIGSALRGAGDVRTPLAVGAIVNLLNAAGTYALVFGELGAPRLGADGAALATGVSVSAGAGIYAWLWARDAFVIPRHRFGDGLDLARARRILRIGIPTFLEQVAWQAGLLLFLSVVADFGTAAVSAYLIGVRVLSFSFVPGIGFAIAASTLVGQNLGAERPELAARAGWGATLRAAGVMGAMGLSIVAVSPWIAEWFGAAGRETVRLTIVFILILGAAQPLMAVEFALGGALRGAGDTRFPLAAILTGLFVFRLGGAWLVSLLLEASVVAIWSCLLADYAVKALLLGGRFASGSWKRLAL